jgi:DNA-binding response OmpR family regulator
VTVAQDGAEAWSCFQRDEFPVVITDWMMPELDGVELVRRIRSDPRAGYVYVILLTAKGQKEDLVEAMDAGADDFLTKPFDRDELRVRLRAGERIVALEQQVRATRVALAHAEKLTAHEIDRGIAAVLDDLTVLRRDVLTAATDQVAEERDRSELRDRFARRFDQSLTDLRRMCDSLRNGSGRAG